MFKDINEYFNSRFGSPKFKVFSPGRANIIGEHTDYNNGYVMPFAIDQGIWFLASPNATNRLNIISFDYNQAITVSLNLEYQSSYPWDKYLTNVLEQLFHYKISGANIVFGGNLPIGAGVSSSSSITCGFLRILAHLNNLNISNENFVELAVQAETSYGVRGGRMDQFAIFNGLEKKAILLDCKNNNFEYIPLDLAENEFYLINTNVKHNLIETEFNDRRSECELAVETINKKFKPIESIRSIHSSDLNILENILDSQLFQRVKYVVEENERVLLAKIAILNSDFQQLGKLLYSSHSGLSELYNVSTKELDWLVEFAKKERIFLGSRMMGGGFGGCTINLLNQHMTNEIKQKIISLYSQRFEITPTIIPVSPKNGILNQNNNIF